ncbi:MAG: hypothetical protein ACK5NK_08375 [Niabella sp.]
MEHKTSDDYKTQRNRQVAGIRSVLDFLVGLVFIVIGVVSFVKFKKDIVMIAFGSVAILYGIWRLYKGYKKRVD